MTSYLSGLWGPLSPTTLENLVILAITFLEKLHLKPSKAAFATVFHGNFRLEVVSDVVSSVAVDYVDMDVRTTFGETGLNSGQIILLFGRLDPFYASLLCSKYLTAFCSRPEVMSDVISSRFVGPVVPTTV